MQNSKVVIVGSVGAGKTTAVKTMTNNHMLDTDEIATDMTQQWKDKTTVALDYGVVKGSSGHKLHLYGAPGQQRFDFMWDIVASGADAIVVLLDATRANAQQDLDFYLNAFDHYAKQARMVVAMTKADKLDSDLNLSSYREMLQSWHIDLDIDTVDVRELSGVQLLLDKALVAAGKPGMSELVA